MRRGRGKKGEEGESEVLIKEHTREVENNGKRESGVLWKLK